MISYRSLMVLSCAALSLCARAQRTATVLPNHIFRVRLVGIQANPVTQTLNSEGDAISLTSKLEQTVTTEKIAAGQAASGHPELEQLRAGLNGFQKGLGDSLLSADLLPKAEMDPRQVVTAVEYGLTPKLSLGIIVPTVIMHVKASFDVRVNNQASQVAAHVNNVPVLSPGMAKLQAQLQANPITAKTFIDNVFTNNGYQTPHDFSYSGLGDIELGAKYQYLNIGWLRGTCLGGVRVPTATHEADRRNIFDRRTGDGQWDLAMECANEVDPFKTLTLGIAGRYTVQLPNSQDMALLKNDESPGLAKLDGEHTRKVDRDLGDYVEGEVSATFHVTPAWSLTGVYGVNYKFSDRYTGPAGYQVESLADNTQTQELRTEVGLGYSSIPAFIEKRIAVPFEIKLAYNSINSGYNVPRSAYTRMDMIVYF